MYFFTHLFISRMLYAEFKDEAGLSRWAFAYGNVKPDLPPDCFGKRHTLENTLFIVYDRANQLAERSLSKKEFSIKLGEICHFVCDFFCHYHLSESLHKKAFPHLLYEIRLHVRLYALHCFGKKTLRTDIRPPAKNISSLIFELRREYMQGSKALKKDILYALKASSCTFRTVLAHAAHKPNAAWAGDDASLFSKGESYEGSAIC